MQLQHLFFDLDHTLWDFEKNSAKAFSLIFLQNNIEVDLDEFLKIYTPINLQYWKLYRDDKISKPELRYSRLRDTFEALDYRISDVLINHLSTVYIDNLPNFNHLFEGTREVLEYLEPKYKLHIITNGFEEVQTQKLVKSNIVHFFDKVITSESVGVKKPNPKIFNHALELAEAKPGNSIMIGDNYEADILGAHQVGMKTIFFNYHNKTFDPQFISIKNLMELKQYL